MALNRKGERAHGGLHGRAQPEGHHDGQLGAAQKSAIETGKKMTASGKKVRYVRSTFVPEEAEAAVRNGTTEAARKPRRLRPGPPSGCASARARRRDQ